MSNKITIGLLWHSFSCDNLGVGALSVSHTSILERICKDVGLEASYQVYGSIGDMDYLDQSLEHKVDVFDFKLREAVEHPIGTLRKFKKCDVFFDIGAGDSFADIYGNRRFYLQAISKLYVLLSGRPLILAPQTIGPFKSIINRIIARGLLRKARMVFPRDEISMSYLKRIIKKPSNAIQTIDVAFKLPFESNIKSPDEQITTVGINISALLHNGGYTGQNQFGLSLNYPSFIDSLILSFLKMHNLRIVLVPHVLSNRYEVEDDRRACKKVAERMNGVEVAPEFNSPSEAKSYIATLDFFVGSRMHATIAAFSSGVPVVPVAYSRKFEGVFRTLGYDRVVDATNVGAGQAVDDIIRAFEERASLKKQIGTGQEAALALLGRYEESVHELFETFGR